MGVLGVIAVSEGDAAACGGCFHEPTEITVVTDHRMAFQISTKQTVLWDQIRYSGDPKEFAWVLPVRPGTVVEASSDAWFATLDAFTVPTIVGPTPSGGGGCGIGCSASSAKSFEDNGGVMVISESVVGPYASVTLRSSDPKALETWLTTNGYVIPASIQPTIGAYVSEKFDFIALKLRPGQGIRAMRPVRVVFSGSDNSLPLRMVAAGVGAQVGITLFVIGEGRYHPQNFPDVTLDDNDLVWDTSQGKSNYADLSLALMAKNDGRSWLTEFAKPVQLQNLDNFVVQGSLGGMPGGYSALCRDELGDAGLFTPMIDGSTTDAAKDASNDASNDASDDANGDASDDASNDASDDASAEDASDDADTDAQSPSSNPCDDLTVAMRYLHPSDTWITRLRGNLPVAALATDLKLEAAPEQAQVSNVHTITKNPVARGGSGCALGGAPVEDIAGTATQIVSCLFLVASMLRRRSKTDAPR
jgi:hypothetical protein